MQQPQSLVQVLRSFQASLEALCGADWLREKPRRLHPAVASYNLCESMILRAVGDTPTVSADDEMWLFSRVMLDSTILATISGGDVKRFQSGDLSSFGSDRVLQKLKHHCRDAQAYDDLFVELSVAASSILAHATVEPLELDNAPDILVRFADDTGAVECKRLRSFSPNAVHRHIRKANRQLRWQGGQMCGALLIHLSAERSISVGPLSDEIPEYVLEAVACIELEFRGGRFHEISRAILTWDEIGQLNSGEGNPWYFFRRRYHECKLVWHSSRSVWPEHLPLFSGFTGAVAFRPSANTA